MVQWRMGAARHMCVLSARASCSEACLSVVLTHGTLCAISGSGGSEDLIGYHLSVAIQTTLVIPRTTPTPLVQKQLPISP